MLALDKIGFIGFGEAANAIVGGWTDRGIEIGDVLHFDTQPHRANVPSLQALTDQCTIIFSTVTAQSAASVAQQVAQNPGIARHFLDLNSVSPQTKRDSASRVQAAGVTYVDVAVMAPVYPKRHKTPLLVSCKASQDIVVALSSRLDMNATAAGESIGKASTIKMLRSIMVKGIEALTDEMMQAAQAAGVSDEVLASLEASKTNRPWPQQALYNIERMETHGQRRGDEMQEVVKTLQELGVAPLLTQGTVKRQYARAKSPLA